MEIAEMPYDAKHEATGCANELFYRSGPTPADLRMTESEYVRDTIMRYLQEAYQAGYDQGRDDA